MFVHLSFAALRVCPSCGTEAAGEETICRHCQIDLPDAVSAELQAPVDEEAPKEARVAPIALSMEQARAEEARARKCLEQGDRPGALLWGRNAIAWLSAQGAEGLIEAAKLDSEGRLIQKKIMQIERPCPACSGSGHCWIQVVSLSGNVIDKEAPGTPCPACRGRGTLMGFLSADERASAMVRAAQSFSILQRKMGREEWMGIWLPVGLSETLRSRQIVALRKGFGVQCPTCSGFGGEGCESCGGTRFTGCSNTGCVQGREICPDCSGTGRLRDTSGTTGSIRSCASCNGSGKRTCTVCAGRSLLTCIDCEGGERLCTRCKGVGQAAACVRCGRTGLAECTRCQGTGTDRGVPCVACKGEGVVPCRTCGGTGQSTK